MNPQEIQLEAIGDFSKSTSHSTSSIDKQSNHEFCGCVDLRNHPKTHKIITYIRINKSYLLNYLTIIINIIVFSILLTNTTDKIKELDGIVKGQRVLWNEFLGQFPNISLAYQKVVDMELSMGNIREDLNNSSAKMSLINGINITKLQSVTNSADKIDPFNERIDLYNKILSHNISASEFKMTVCPVILVDFEASGTEWYSDCVYQLCDNRLMRVLIKITNSFSAKLCVDDNVLLRYKNGILKWNMSVSLAMSQTGMRYVCQEQLFGSPTSDALWIIKGQIVHENIFFVLDYPTWNYTVANC